MALPKIRPATAEETESIRKVADLGPGCSVVAFDPPGQSSGPILAVLRTGVVEVDPVVFNGATDRQKAIFMSLLESGLAFSGIQQYYFNIPADDETYRTTLKSWGAEVVSPAPELRMKKSL